MLCKKMSIQNALIPAWNAMVSITSKVRDNVLHIMMVLVVVPQTAIALSPASKLPYKLVRSPKTLMIKQVCMPSRKPKGTKMQP